MSALASGIDRASFKRTLDGRGAWSEFPAEDWILLSGEELKQLLPGNDPVKIGATWEIPREIATKILTHFYPATENNDVSKNVFEKQSLKGTIISLENGRARERLTGEMKMAHSFYHKPDGKMVEATVLGFVDFVPGKGTIDGFQLVTDEATYNGGKFAAAVRLMR